MDTIITNMYDELSKVRPINDWRYTNNYASPQFQQFSSGKHGSSNFNYILCKMTENKGQWCTAVK